MAVITQNTTVGVTTGFEFDTYGSVTARSRTELNGANLDEVSSSVSGTSLTVPSQANYVCGPIHSVSRVTSGEAIDFIVQPNAVAQVTNIDAQQFRAGTIDIQAGGTLVVTPDGNQVYPGNSGTSGGISSLRLNGTLQSTSAVILHGRALSPTATVNLDGLALVGAWGIQFPTSADWIGVVAPDPASVGDSGSNDRFFRAVQPNLGNVAQRWAVIQDGEWQTSTSNVLQINRSQYTVETDYCLIGPASQFPNITTARLGSNSGSSDGAVQTLRRLFAWNPIFTDADTGDVISANEADMQINFSNVQIERAYKSSTDKTLVFNQLPYTVNGEYTPDTGTGYWLQTGSVQKTTANTQPTEELPLDHSVAQTVFTKCFSHLSSPTEVTTEHHVSSGLAVFSESTTIPLAMDTALNGHVLNLGLEGFSRAPLAIQPTTDITSTDNIYPALKFAWWNDQTNNAALPLTSFGPDIQFNGRLNINHGADTNVPSGRSIVRTNAFTVGTKNNFILNSSSSTNASLDGVAITGDLTVTKAATASSGHNLFITDTTVDGVLSLRNEHTSAMQFLNAGLAANTFGGLDVGDNIVLNLDIDEDIIVDLDLAWGPQIYGSNVTIENDGTGMVTISSSTAGAAGVTISGNAVLLETITFNNATEAGSVMRIYDQQPFILGGSVTAQPIAVSTEPGGPLVINVLNFPNVVGIVAAPGFMPRVVEVTGLTTSRSFASPALTPDGFADLAGTPAGHSLGTDSSAGQTAGASGIMLNVSGADVSRLAGTSTNALFAQAVTDQGLGRGMILNWRTDLGRTIDAWVAPNDSLIAFPSRSNVDISTFVQLRSSTSSPQLLQGVNESTNGVFNTNTATVSAQTVASIGNTTPDANVIRDGVVDDVTPILQGAVSAAEAARDATWDTNANLDKLTT